MSKSFNLLFLPISICFISIASSINSEVNAAGTNGADIYCFMRNGGISHEPSWEAAYQSIKNKKQGFFKTSPKQAASMIVEEVAESPEKYENCIKFLGDLYSEGKINLDIPGKATKIQPNESNKEADSKKEKGAFVDRYSY